MEGVWVVGRQYDWTVHVRRRCGLMSNYFDHLLLLSLSIVKIQGVRNKRIYRLLLLLVAALLLSLNFSSHKVDSSCWIAHWVSLHWLIVLSDNSCRSAATIPSSSEPADWRQHHQGSPRDGGHLQPFCLHPSSCRQLWTARKVSTFTYLPFVYLT